MNSGILYLLAAACLWGTIGPVSKLVFAAGITPIESAFWRGTVAGAAYTVHYVVCYFSRPKRNTLTLHRPHVPWIMAFGVLGVALLEGSYVYAVHEGGASLASVLLYSAPLWVNLFGWIIFRETISRRQLTALTFTTAGIAMICLWGSPVSYSLRAVIIGLTSGVSYALFYLAGRVFFEKSHPVAVYMIAFPVGSLALLPFIYWMYGLGPLDLFNRVKELPFVPLAALWGVGFFSTYIPYIFYGLGLRTISTGRAAIIASVEPVVSIILATLMWNESFSAIGYVAAAIVIVGVVLAG